MPVLCEPRDSPQRRQTKLGSPVFLPRETRNYVPAFMAVAYLMEFPAEHNIFPRDVAPPFAFLDAVMVDEVMRFDQIAPLLTR